MDSINDQLHMEGRTIPLKVRSLVGLIPAASRVEALDDRFIQGLPASRSGLDWFLKHRPDLKPSYLLLSHAGRRRRPLSPPPGHPVTRTGSSVCCPTMLDEEEFLSPYGVRSLSRYHNTGRTSFRVNGEEYRVATSLGSPPRPSSAATQLAGPIWFPINYLLIEALERYHQFPMENDLTGRVSHRFREAGLNLQEGSPTT